MLHAISLNLVPAKCPHESQTGPLVLDLALSLTTCATCGVAVATQVHVHAWPPSLHNTQGSKRRRKAAVPIELQERHDISRRKAAEKMREEAVRRRQHKDRRSKAWKACRMEKAPKSTYSGGQSTALVKDPVVVTPDISSCRGSGASPGSASLGVVSDNVQR